MFRISVISVNELALSVVKWGRCIRMCFIVSSILFTVFTGGEARSFEIECLKPFKTSEYAMNIFISLL